MRSRLAEPPVHTLPAARVMAASYCTAMVTPCWLELAPTVTITGTAGPPVMPAGIATSIRITPAISPGAPPAKFGVTVVPPIETLTDKRGCGGEVEANWPSTPAGAVSPSPVAKREITSPGFAGLAGLLIDP